MTENNQPPLVTSPYLQPTTPQWSNTPPPEPKKPSFFKRHWLILTVGVVALALGSGMGAAGAEPETVEVIKEVKVPGPERIITKEVKVNVPTTPAVCLHALSLNEEAFDLAAAALGAISARDVATANGYTAKIKALAPSVNAAKAVCRAS